MKAWNTEDKMNNERKPVLDKGNIYPESERLPPLFSLHPLVLPASHFEI